MLNPLLEVVGAEVEARFWHSGIAGRVCGTAALAAFVRVHLYAQPSGLRVCVTFPSMFSRPCFLDWSLASSLPCHMHSSCACCKVRFSHTYHGWGCRCCTPGDQGAKDGNKNWWIYSTEFLASPELPMDKSELLGAASAALGGLMLLAAAFRGALVVRRQWGPRLREPLVHYHPSNPLITVPEMLLSP